MSKFDAKKLLEDQNSKFTTSMRKLVIEVEDKLESAERSLNKLEGLTEDYFETHKSPVPKDEWADVSEDIENDLVKYIKGLLETAEYILSLAKKGSK